jgi:hypothetical protein
VTAAIFLLALARFGGDAFNAFTLIALSANLSFVFGALPVFGFALAGFDQGVSAGIALFIGQRAQHNT